MTCLFEPITIGGQKLDNRIVVSPMCQFAAEDGKAAPWHMQHLGSLALSGAGLLMLESTAVSKEGRISKGCLGLYHSDHQHALARLVNDIRTFSGTPLGIQLAHSGRKGSTRLPWEGEGQLESQEGAWRTIAPSPIPFADRPTPCEMTPTDMERILSDYVEAASRAVAAGFSVVELHAAHGYLLHQFLSPLTNRRSDAYGGNPQHRMRFPLEVWKVVRATVPSSLGVGARVSGTDWHHEGAGIAEAVEFAEKLEELGADYLCVSSGGIIPGAAVKVGPCYQVPFAEEIKRRVRIPVMAVGMISEAEVANTLVAEGKADLVALARAFLHDPRWVWRAAEQLGADLPYPVRYQAAHPHH
jgi:2,4-dienoyl-CoA reductase-like NADH-dependent reductase (Old Yellow Enzyme family)